MEKWDVENLKSEIQQKRRNKIQKEQTINDCLKHKLQSWKTLVQTFSLVSCRMINQTVKNEVLTFSLFERVKSDEIKTFV